MLTPLFKKPKFASTVGSMLTVVFGCLSLFTVLMKDFPQPLVWLLCLLSPSAFSIGIAQVKRTRLPTSKLHPPHHPIESKSFQCFFFYFFCHFTLATKPWFIQILLKHLFFDVVYMTGGLPGSSGGQCCVFLLAKWPPPTLRANDHAGSWLRPLLTVSDLPGSGATR